MPYESGQEWFEKLFTETCNNEERDLIGFTPVKNLESAEFDDLGPGSIGIAIQIEKVEKTATESLIVTMRGICRYENIGFLPAPPDGYFNIAVRWFEDNQEPDAVVRPHYEKYLKNIEWISRVGGERMKGFFNVSQTTQYHYDAAHYGSFMFVNSLENWFSFEEQMELFKLTSTSERLKRVNERMEKLIPLVEKREQLRRVGRNN